MPKKKAKKKLNPQQRVGKGQMGLALAGRTSIGGKMKPADRKKLLNKAGENIARGNAKAKRKK